MITAKEITKEVNEVSNEEKEYTLVEPMDAKKVDGTKVTIAKSLGTYRVSDLEREKERVEAELAIIVSKIASITKLTK